MNHPVQLGLYGLPGWRPLPFLRWLSLLVFLSLVAPLCRADVIRHDANLEIQDGVHKTPARLVVEIADTPAARGRGLMGRELLDDDSGVLFIFPDAAPRIFWMHDTPGSLDMIFADAEHRIIHIARDTQPFSDQLYPSQGAAQYVLEVRGGFAARHNILPGMKILHFRLTDQ